MKYSYQYLTEQNNNETCGVLSFGRMNPPTNGHLKLIQKVKELAKQYGAKYHIVLSYLQDHNKNPLSPEQKIKYLKLYSPDTNFEIATKEYPGIIQQAERLNKLYDHLHVVCGDDRISEFQILLHKYNGRNYAYKTITLHSAGKRNKSKDGVIGISGTKMRQYAKDGNFVDFSKGIPKYIPFEDKENLYNNVRNGLNINEMAQGYPITPDGGPGDNPNPVKEKEVDLSKVKSISPKKQKKWNNFRSGDIQGSKIGANSGQGIGPTYDTRYNGTASASGGIGDPAFRESIDSPSETPFLPAYGISGSGNKDQIMSVRQADLQKNSPSKLKNGQKWKDFRKSLGVPIG